jgi:hypothetical protein
MATKTFKEQVADERERQVKLGYTAEHDDKHGPVHLMNLALKYEQQGDFVKASAVYKAYEESAERIKKKQEK